MLSYRMQPARLAIKRAGLTTNQAADRMQVPRHHLLNSLKGTTRPSQLVRERLPELVGQRIEDLYEPHLLAAPYRGDIDYPCDSKAAHS